ncbi:MAG: GAF domain-containing sensor histidine kinase, partial [Pseudomonas sp.]
SQQLVIVEDIGQSPLWQGLRALALDHGLRACWSIPLLSHRREVLGTFAIYQRRALAPDDEQLQLIGIAGQLAAIAIKRQHNRLRLQESEQRYRSLFTFNPDPVFSLNLDGAYESLNRAGCELSGYREEELLGQSFSALLLPEELPRVSAHFRAARAGAAQHFEAQARTRDGQILELDVTNLPIMVDERIVGVFGIAKDISERNRMTRALREANQAMRERDQFFTLSLEMFCMLGLQGDFIQVNTAFLDVLGYPLECLIGHPYLELIHPQERPQLVEEVRRLLAGQALRDLEVRVLDARGQEHWLQLSAALGDDQLIYCAARDISERKAAEQVLRATLAELERSNRELQEFAFVASHDLQEPLRKIQAFAERLEARAGELDAQSRDYLQRMSSAAGRMQSLIRDLLAYSRVTTRAQPFQRLDLELLLDEVLQDMDTALDSSGARIEREPLPQVLGDPTQLRQLLQNLLSNALKFHQEGQPPHVRVYAERMAPGEWTLCVADRGIGFDEKYLDRIFNPFQRLHGHQAYPGTGIGLAIVKKIVERHGARITASSRPGQGTRFRITFKSLG